MRALIIGVAGAALAVSGMTGCAAAAVPDVRSAATAFQDALRVGDAAAACERLSDAARAQLEQTTAQPCAAALTRLRLPALPPGDVAVWGDEAQVGLGSGALFLAEFADGWRVTAAGCTARPDLPYRCAVRG